MLMITLGCLVLTVLLHSNIGFAGMMRQMNNMFMAMSREFGDGVFGDSSGGQMYKRTIVEKYHPGPNGAPQLERYEDKIAKAYGNGHKVSERQQLYQNSAGYQKAAHERAMNNKGHKLICEKVGENERYKNYFKNLEESKCKIS
jgi:hypothetical protein